MKKDKIIFQLTQMIKSETKTWITFFNRRPLLTWNSCYNMEKLVNYVMKTIMCVSAIRSGCLQFEVVIPQFKNCKQIQFSSIHQNKCYAFVGCGTNSLLMVWSRTKHGSVSQYYSREYTKNKSVGCIRSLSSVEL